MQKIQNTTAPLSDGEFEIMECVWKSPEALTQTNIMRMVNDRHGRSLKVATVATYLRRIIWKGYLEKVDIHDGHPTYHALVGMEEYYHCERKKFKQRWGDMITKEGGTL